MPDPVTVTRRTYDAVAPDYARTWSAPVPDIDRDIDHLCAALPPAALVADVGCGPGRDTTRLRRRGLRVVGIDLSAGMLRAGGLHGTVQADMRRLPLGDHTLDAVWCHAALLHVPRPDVPTVLREFARVTRPTGMLTLTVAEGDGEGWEEATYRPGGRRWYVYHRSDDLVSALHDHQFTVLTTHTHPAHRTWLTVHARRTPADQQERQPTGRD